MESQFILRLPEKLKGINLLEAKIIKIDSKKVKFIYNDTVYIGIISRPATIIETQKLLDNKLYKIADINSLVTILDEKYDDYYNPYNNYDANTSNMEDNNYNIINSNNMESNNMESNNMESNNINRSNMKDSSKINEMIEDLNVSGITQPLKYCKLRRFKKTSKRMEMYQEIEKEVNKLIEEDMKAVRVEIINPENKEVDDIAAEIENELDIIGEDEDMDDELYDLDDEINGALVDDENLNVNDDENGLNLNDDENENGYTQIGSKQIGSKNASSNEEEEEDKEIDIINNNANELKELLEIINEKEISLKAITNPILRKRYQHSLNELKEEYERKKDQ